MISNTTHRQCNRYTEYIGLSLVCLNYGWLNWGKQRAGNELKHEKVPQVDSNWRAIYNYLEQISYCSDNIQCLHALCPGYVYTN